MGEYDSWYGNDPNQNYVNAPKPQKHLDNFEKIGLLNEVPTFENLIPWIDEYCTWYKGVDKDWNVFTQEEKNGGIFVTLHWTLSHVLSDPHLDPKVFEYVYKNHLSKFAITLVNNGGFPEKFVKEMIENTGSKTDPTKGTKGGEITCFVLHNKSASAKIVDLCARKTKKVTIQRDVVDHPNVSRETLVYLSQEGKNPNVKKDALSKLVDKGWLNVV